MKRSFILILVFTIFSSINVIDAQEKKNKMNREEWFAQMRNYKHKFIADEIKLTPEQEAKFFPIYNMMEDELFQGQRETRKLKKKAEKDESVSDSEYEAATKAIIDLKRKEHDIELKYYYQIKPIISSKQYFKLKAAEHKFTRIVMKRHNQKGKKK